MTCFGLSWTVYVDVTRVYKVTNGEDMKMVKVELSSVFCEEPHDLAMTNVALNAIRAGQFPGVGQRL